MSAAPPALTPATVKRLQRQIGNRAVVRVLAREPKPPMPTSERRAAPGTLPGLPLSAKQRDRFEKEAHSRINQAFTAFTDAAKAHAESLKAKAKADAEIAAVALDIFFGLSAPVFAGLIMSQGGRLKRAAEKISGALSLGKGEAEKTVKLISETDFLKETFKGVGKIGSTAIKANATALFGEAEGDAFARHLRVSMHGGVQAITDRIGEMTDDELLTTWAAYDFEFTNEEAYTEALKATFGAFEDLVEPIGKWVKTTQYGSHGGEVKAVWLSVYGKRRLAVVDFMWAPKGFTGTERWRRFKGWVPPELEQYAIEKNKRKFGEVEEIDPATLEKAPPDPGDRPKKGRVLIDWGPRPRVPIRTSRDRVPIASGGSKPRIPIRSGGGPP